MHVPIKLPSFRNILTTGNITSAMAAAFIAGMLWGDVNNKLNMHNDRLTKIEKTESDATTDVQELKKEITKTEERVSYVSMQIADLKRWLEKISDQVSATKK